MRCDVITAVGAEGKALDCALAVALSAWPVAHESSATIHLETVNGGRIYLHDGPDYVGVGLSSSLDEVEHNAWAESVFAAVVAATTGDVELLDEDDNVIRARHSTAA